MKKSVQPRAVVAVPSSTAAEATKPGMPQWKGI